MGSIEIVLAMLASVVAGGLVVRALPFAVPLPLVQIALGSVIAASTDNPVRLDPEFFFLLFLPPLLFLDGWLIPKKGLLRDKGMILALALGLVFFTMLGMGLFIHWMIPAMSMPMAFALAAILSPTDPVAISSITERVALPPRAHHVLAGESLLNDASGLVCFRFAVAAVLTGSFSLPAAAITFLWLAIGGVATGILLTGGLLWLKNLLRIRFGEESGSQVLISLLLPFAAYMTAEELGCSGILAAVSAGITMSYIELTGRTEGSTRMQRGAVWDTVQFALKGVMFVLLGEQLPSIFDSAVTVVRDTEHSNPAWLALYILAIHFGLTLLRFAWVWISMYVPALVMRLRGGGTRKLPGPRIVAAMSLAGVRGAITLAGVLTLPLMLPDGSPFPARGLAILLAAGVIIMSMLMANVFLPRLLRGLEMSGEPLQEQHVDRARVLAAEAAIQAIGRALDAIPRSAADASLSAEAAARVMDLYQRRIQGQAQTGETAARIRRSNEIERQIRLTGLRAERETIFALARSSTLSDEESRRLVREVDLMEERLK
ncbi:MAG: Na+/H+ antiporter [Steroidobacteraceae bacterium]